jgi:hypothetical protein
MARPRCLVETGAGIGDIIEATPTCHALWLLGFDVDLLIDRPDASRIAPLFENIPALGRVFTERDRIDSARHDMAIACFGAAQAARWVATQSWHSAQRARFGLDVGGLRGPTARAYDGRSRSGRSSGVSTSPGDPNTSQGTSRAGSARWSISRTFPRRHSTVGGRGTALSIQHVSRT